MHCKKAHALFAIWEYTFILYISEGGKIPVWELKENIMGNFGDAVY